MSIRFLLLSGSFITFPVVSAVSVRSSVEAPSLIESPEEGHSQTLSPGQLTKIQYLYKVKP